MIKKIFLTCVLLLNSFIFTYAVDAWIRINQMGYHPDGKKKAVLISESLLRIDKFTVHDALTSEKLAEYNTVSSFGKFDRFETVFILNFSEFKTQGAFYIKADHYYSPTIFINKNIYNGSADFLLNYMREQRCGYNPVLNSYCHQYDGYEVDGTKKDVQAVVSQTAKQLPKSSTKKSLPEEPVLQLPRLVDATGGWHDASDYLRYGTTSATAIFQMLFAYRMNPLAFDDKFDALGRAKSNGIPDVLDEAKWGLDWLVKMNPANGVLYHQVADDRDHSSFRLPEEDTVDYGWGAGKQRPVYIATGKPQGLFNFTNRSTGIASLAGKYSSAFALGSGLLRDYYPVFADSLEKKAFETYEYGKKHPGVCQTAPARAPYFYEEDNWVDDMELAATQLYYLSFESKYVKEAAEFGRMEPVIPWLYSDTAKHYQWYPFINYGHYMLANMERPAIKSEFIQNIYSNLERASLHRNENPFGVGVPMLWCSNNYVSALATQCNLYRRYTGDSTFLDMETALTDWLFGCNPWGTSMVIGLPETGISPRDPHSALSHSYQIPLSGGLIDGPVRKTIFESLIGIELSKPDANDRLQTDWAVYHDDYADYSTNEPTMDGTASLMYLLSTRQFENTALKQKDQNKYVYGAVVRTNPTKKQISLIFSGNEFAEGKNDILRALNRLNIKASFFFTGDFLRNHRFKKLVEELHDKGHYIGPHSDKHLLYCSMTDRDSLKVTKDVFLSDLKKNYRELEKFGVKKSDAPFFLPPYEWYNDSISRWCKEVGVTLVNFTPGTRSNADYSIPEMREHYYSSIEIYNQIMAVKESEGLNGHIMLFHVGTDVRRTDKFYKRLYSLLLQLKQDGYEFVDLYQSTNLIIKENKPEKKKRKNK